MENGSLRVLFGIIGVVAYVISLNHLLQCQFFPLLLGKIDLQFSVGFIDEFVKVLKDFLLPVKALLELLVYFLQLQADVYLPFQKKIREKMKNLLN